MYLFFDTETTGLPKAYGAPLHDLDNWPRLVQLAYLLLDEDGKELLSQDRIVRPDGFAIPAQAAAVHGITTERALAEGEYLEDVLAGFESALENTGILVAHNISYDEKIVGAEFLRTERRPSFLDLPKICTMQAATDFCAIPSGRGYKWPRLNELHQKLFGTDFANAHDALADVRATAKCFFELKERGVL